MRTTAVVLAADAMAPRGFAPAWATLVDRPVCAWALDALAGLPEIERVTLVVGERRRAAARALLAAGGWAHVELAAVPPGLTTPGAVLRAACAGGDEANASELVLLHEGARPVLAPSLVRTLLREADAYRIVAAAVSLKETLKWVDRAGMVRATPARAALWQVITPVVLPRAALCTLPAGDTGQPKVAPGQEGPAPLARWVVEHAPLPVHLVNAGHDESMVRRRADLAILEERLRGEGVPADFSR